jgi:hypothetical protein
MINGGQIAIVSPMLRAISPVPRARRNMQQPPASL